MNKWEIMFVLFVVIAAMMVSGCELRIDVNGYYGKNIDNEKKLCERKVNNYLMEYKKCNQ